MPRKTRLLFFLILNVIVSTCVTVSVLFVYDHYVRTRIPAQLMVSTPASVLPVETQPPVADAIPIEIVTVLGAGTAGAEVVTIRYTGEDQVSLTDWRLLDDDGNVFIFPQLKLYANGAVQVHTGAGTNSVVDLYWGLNTAVWQPGDVASLLDAQGAVRALYRIP